MNQVASAQLPYGSWPSPLTARSLVAGAAGVGEVIVDGQDIWWSESRPEEKGRVALVRWRNGERYEPLDGDANVRTGVHEYGGGAWWVANETLWFTDHGDQRLRRLDLSAADAAPVMLTAQPPTPRSLRYADGRPGPDGDWLVCVQEVHEADSHEPANRLVAVSGDGSQQVNVLVDGPDFVAAPRLSADGTKLAWIQWNHPNMPWDTTELWLGSFNDGQLSDARRIAGGTDESILEPEWGPDGALYAITDRTQWWNLYRWTVDDDYSAATLIVGGEFEIATPAWVFNMIRYAVHPDGSVFCAVTADGRDRLRLPDGSMMDQWTSVTSVRATADGGAVFVGADFQSEPAVVRIDASGTAETIRSGRPLTQLKVTGAHLPTPEHITFATGDGSEVAHALFYPPANPNVAAPAGELPPLLVKAHGGPTGAARSQMQLGTAYWTSRGVAVVDVNYRGSVGYGRTYRHRLNPHWGIADVEDCVAVARHLADAGLVDGDRLAIAGGSAGGFTVLAALTFHDVFAVGASRYGIADLGVLASDTHKFEARYLDRLIGPWPEAKATYDARSPINHTDQLSCPMIILQGSEDAVVPPNQAELMVEALAAKGLPHAYLLFDGEGHGFRQADNIVTALESELSFFGAMLGFTPAGDMPELRIL